MAHFCLLLFMQNLLLLHQQLVIVLVARIRLLWIFFIQLRIHRHRRRFHRYWIFPRPAESCFENHVHLRNFHSVLFQPGVVPYVAKFDDPMTDGCQGTNDFLA